MSRFGKHAGVGALDRSIAGLIYKSSVEAQKRALQGSYLTTQEQRRRLETMAPDLRIFLNGSPCYGITGILREEIRAVQSTDQGAVRDAAIIAHARKIQH